MKQILKDFEEREGYKLTFETYCTECDTDFECQEFIPDRIYKTMLKEGTDDCVYHFIGNTSDERFIYCPKCRKEMGMD